ncbi:GYD domain-containing protein [Chloroflexota bacterium]
MATFVMFGEYSREGLKGISADRTMQANEILRKFGGEVSAGYALLGTIDLVLIVDFPRKEQAMQASVALSKLTGIAFRTAPAVAMAEFDRLMADV